jgi:hypothetical protein
MASGVFCVAWSGHFELGLEARAHQGVERFVLDLHPVGLAHPRPERFIRGKACGPLEGLLKTGEHRWCERDRFAGGDVRCQQGLQPPSGIPRQPAADGVAMDSQETCHIPAVLGLLRRQPVEPVSPRLLLAVMGLV